jgi:hypothetical protein
VRIALVRVVVACLAATWLGAALAISYTVQVIAVSDQSSALSISRDLLRDGYPAYVVRSTGAQGDVYRVRVGAFANRGAALRYAESMPEVAGSRPVPALAEAIPQGIMPLAPRLLLQLTWDEQDVRVSPWPGGLAVRIQHLEPLRQALYVVFQDGSERRFEAWAAVPLAVLPEPLLPPELDVPMVDLTVAPDDDPEDDPADEAEPAPADDEGGAEADPAADTSARDAEEAAAEAVDGLAAWLADPRQDEAEAGLLLLRDRWLWPPSWSDDSDEVRAAFRASLVAIVSRELDTTDEAVDALSYLPGGALPPALVVLDLADPSARDAGRVVGLGDPAGGLRTHGPETLIAAPLDEMPSWPEERVRRDAPPTDQDLGGSAWTVTADGGFVRITLVDGATWRAGVGTPLWSDGRFVVAWDGEMLLLYDFVVR